MESSNLNSLEVAFIGLGTMGYPMASHVAQHFECFVWNRTYSRSAEHESTFASHACKDLVDLCHCQVIITCLPTSQVVKEIAHQIVDHIRPGTIWIDCTSGDPSVSTAISQFLSNHVKGIQFLDAPVSGGPNGATDGILTVMVSGDRIAFDIVLPILSTFAAEDRIRYVSEQIGAAHAIKAIDNTLNVTQLMLAAEGLVALKKLGVDPQTAVDVINVSSGRSFMTEKRIPEEVLTRNFNYGFKLGLMTKDVQIANSIMDTHFYNAILFRGGLKYLQTAQNSGSLLNIDDMADYTEVVKLIEMMGGNVELKPNDVTEEESSLV